MCPETTWIDGWIGWIGSDWIGLDWIDGWMGRVGSVFVVWRVVIVDVVVIRWLT